MARGKANKLRKAERESNKGALGASVSTSSSRRPDEGPISSPPSHPYQIEDHVIECDHSNVSPAQLLKASSLFKELFLVTFDLAAWRVIRNIPRRMQNALAREHLIEFGYVGFDIQLIKQISNCATLKDEFKLCIEQYCGEHFGETLLMACSDEWFDDLCNFGSHYDHHLNSLGPPCACSFTACLFCLEHLVEFKKNAGTPPPDESSQIDEGEVESLIESLAKGEWINESISLDDLPHRAEISEALDRMRRMLWEAAGELNPLAFKSSKESRDFVAGLSGLELYYTVVMRELVAKTPATIAAENTTAAGLPAPRFTFRGLHRRCQSDVKQLLHSEQAKELTVESMAIGYRKFLARKFRDAGNTAYAVPDFVIANAMYTRAIAYDPEDPIYPLNRAASRLKLKCFAAAEVDCSTVLEKDPRNHKAYFRRGVSKVGQWRYEEAKSDFEEVLKLQGNNTAALKEIANLEGKYSNQLYTPGKAEEENLILATKYSTSNNKDCKAKLCGVIMPNSNSASKRIPLHDSNLLAKTSLLDVLREKRRSHSRVQDLVDEATDLAIKRLKDLSPGLQQVRKRSLVPKKGRPSSVASRITKSKAVDEMPSEESTVAAGTHPRDSPSNDTAPPRLTVADVCRTPHHSESDISTDSNATTHHRAHAARVSRLLEGLQSCRENMDSADALKRKEALISASFLVKEFETQALLENGRNDTDPASKEGPAPPSDWTSCSKSLMSTVTCTRDEGHADAPGASETSDQRRARLDAEIYDQLYFTWAFIHLAEQKTGAQIMKRASTATTSGQGHQEDTLDSEQTPTRALSIDAISDRRGSDSGIERSPVVKSQQMGREKSESACEPLC